MKTVATTILLGSTLNLMACGGNGPQTASDIAGQISQACANSYSDLLPNTPAQTEGTCTTTDGSMLDIATFNSETDLNSWLQEPDTTQETYVVGTTWAVGFETGNDTYQIEQALGGHEVTNVGG